MAESKSPKHDTSGAQNVTASKCSALDLLENIKTHSYEYTQTQGDEQNFLKALNHMRMEQMFTDLIVHVQVRCSEELTVKIAIPEHAAKVKTHELPRPPNAWIVITDVIGLYTHIPHQEGKDAIRNY